MSMGEHCELMVKQWRISRQAQDELALASHLNAIRADAEGVHDDLLVPFAGLTRDNNLRADTTLEKLAKLRPAFDRSSGAGTLTAGNSTPLTDGAVNIGGPASPRHEGFSAACSGVQRAQLLALVLE